MADDLLQTLETLCFDYEDGTIQGMLKFATEIRDRRLQYCRDRQAVLQAQRAALASMSSPTPTNQGNQNFPNSPVNQRVPGDQFSPWSTPTNFNMASPPVSPNAQRNIQLSQVPPRRSFPSSPTPPPPRPPPNTPAGTHQQQAHTIQPPQAGPTLVPPGARMNYNEGGEGPAIYQRAQSTPINCCSGEGGENRVKFPPHVDTNTISQISPGSTNPTSYPTGPRTTSTTYVVPSSAASLSQKPSCKHSSAMIECPICEGPLLICLTPLCGDSLGRRTCLDRPTIATTSVGTGSTSSLTGNTLYQQQYLTDITVSGYI